MYRSSFLLKKLIIFFEPLRLKATLKVTLFL